MKSYDWLISFLRRFIFACLLFLLIFFFDRFSISIFEKDTAWLLRSITEQQNLEQIYQNILELFRKLFQN